MTEINTNLDTTPLPPNNLVAKDPQSAELAGYVRTKTFGREVREAIARSIELNSTRSKSAEILANETVNVANDLTDRFNQQIGALTEDSEVIDARGGEPTLRDRLAKDTTRLDSMYVNILEYGVTGDGVNDDTMPFMEAVEVAKATGKTLLIPDEIKLNLPNPTNIREVRYLEAKGEITCPELTIGYSSTQPWQSNYYVKRITGVAKIVGLKSSQVTIQVADKVLLYANGDDPTISSIAYSIFNFGFIREFEIFSEGTAVGWVNENIFNGGRLSKITIDGNYNHNNNTWYKPQFDDLTVNITNGSSNVFHDCRFEGTANINFGSLSYDNTFIKTYTHYIGATYLGYSKVTVSDLGFNNRVVSLADTYTDVKEIIKIDRQNYNDTKFSTDGLYQLLPPAWKEVAKTTLIPLNTDFGLSLSSDKANWRMTFEFYDQNFNLIKENLSDRAYVSVAIKHTTNGTHANSTNSSNLKASFMKRDNVAKYVLVKVTSGAAPTAFSNLNVKIQAYKTDMPSVSVEY